MLIFLDFFLYLNKAQSKILTKSFFYMKIYFIQIIIDKLYKRCDLIIFNYKDLSKLSIFSPILTPSNLVLSEPKSAHSTLSF
jgi:hypothetical protein